MAIYAAPVHDEKYAAEFIIKTILDLKQGMEGYMFWCLSDIYEEIVQLNLPFFGGFGLFSVDGIPKPSYHAFKLLSKLYPNRLESSFRTNEDVEYAVLRDGENYQILVYAQSNDPLEDKEYQVNLELNVCANSVSMESIDDTHCNPKKMWLEIGRPDYLKPAEVVQIKKDSELKSYDIPYDKMDDGILISFKIRTNDIKLLSIS